MTDHTKEAHSHANCEKEQGLQSIFHEPIKQRHKWDEPQAMPHVKWVDLFHDLFFVGMAYNLGNLVLGVWATPVSILYFVGLYFPCAISWNSKMYFDSRFEVGNSLYQKFLLVIELCLLSSEIVHIQELDKMRNPSKYINMFAFSLATFLHRILGSLRSLEVYFQSSSTLEGKSAAILDLKFGMVPTLLCLSAAVVSGIPFFRIDDFELDHHRHLAEETTSGIYSFNDIPIILLLFSYISYQTAVFFQVIIFFPKNGKHKKLIAPMNVEYSIHRNGEWIMLMLGETVLSLLIVHVPSGIKEYYATFFFAIISAVLMQFLHFQSEPCHPEHHAIRRHKNAGFMYTTCNQLYSAALVAIGFSYKMMLTMFNVEVISSEETSSSTIESDNFHRKLAGGGGVVSSMENEKRQSRVAIFFCVSMVLALVFLDLMSLAHKSAGENTLSHRAWSSTKKKLFAATVVKILAIMFIGLTELITNEPVHLALIGFGVLIVSVGCRTFIERVERRAVHEVDMTARGP